MPPDNASMVLLAPPGLAGLKEGQMPEARFVPEITHQGIQLGLDERVKARGSLMTVVDFVETKFVPEHVATKLHAGQQHYRSMLRLVLGPDETDRIFQNDSVKRKAPKATAGWPYLGSMALSEVEPQHVRSLVSAALDDGYSTQTAAHIRSVVSAIFSFAAKAQLFTGNNPAMLVSPPEMTHAKEPPLTLSQLNQVIREMRYPEKEIALIIILTGMNVAEICGLRWNCVNLTDEEQVTDGERIPSHTIAVRRQSFRGSFGNVKKKRNRSIHMHWRLIPILRELSHRSKFVGPDDLVLVSRVGTPVNETNLVVRRLKPIGQALRIPLLTWRTFSRTRKALKAEYGELYEQYAGLMVRFVTPRAPKQV